MTAPGGSGIFGLAHVNELAIVIHILFVMSLTGVFDAREPSAAEFAVVVVIPPSANLDAVLVRTNAIKIVSIVPKFDPASM